MSSGQFLCFPTSALLFRTVGAVVVVVVIAVAVAVVAWCSSERSPGPSSIDLVCSSCDDASAVQRTASPPPPPLQLLPQSQSNQRQTRRKKPTSQSKLIDLHRAVRQFIWTLFPVSACALVSLKMKMMTTGRQVMITLVAALHYLHCRSVHTSTHTHTLPMSTVLLLLCALFAWTVQPFICLSQRLSEKTWFNSDCRWWMWWRRSCCCCCCCCCREWTGLCSLFSRSFFIALIGR